MRGSPVKPTERSGDTVVNELSRYFHLSEYESEIEFALMGAPYWMISEAPTDFAISMRGTRDARGV